MKSFSPRYSTPCRAFFLSLLKTLNEKRDPDYSRGQFLVAKGRVMLASSWLSFPYDASGVASFREQA